MKKQVNVRLNENLIKKLKLLAIKENMTMQDLFEDLILKGLDVKDLIEKKKA